MTVPLIVDFASSVVVTIAFADLQWNAYNPKRIIPVTKTTLIPMETCNRVNAIPP